MKVIVEHNALTEKVLRAPPARQIPFNVAPKAQAARAGVHRQSRRHENCILNAVRSDKQADQADSNTLQLIADITQYAVPELLENTKSHHHIQECQISLRYRKSARVLVL